jgi:C4-dicarboxylate transporter DctM subunit
MILLITAIFFFITIIIGLPLYFSIGLATIIYFMFAGGFPIEIILQRIETTSESFPLLAVPFFVLAGNLIMAGGAGKRIVKVSDSMVRWMPGGLAMVTVVAAMIFAGMSGSLIADTAAIGSIMIPGMIKRGYHRNYATGLLATSGSIGVIIPPSIPIVLYGFIAGVSVGDLFLGGFIPGIIVGLSLMIAAGILAHIRKYPTEPAAGLSEIFHDLIVCFPALMTLVIILGGIFLGIFTVTESAAVAVVYALIIGFFVYKELKPAHLPKILVESTITSATILLVIGVVDALSWGLTANNVPQQLTSALVGLTNNKYLILLLINAILLILGSIMGMTPALLLATPLLLPVAKAFGIELIHLGMIIVTNLAIGSYTPPVGGSLYVASQIGEISIWETTKGMFPFMCANVIALLLVTYIPDITLLIPKLAGAIPW